MNFSFRYDKSIKKHTIQASTESIEVVVSRKLCSGVTKEVEKFTVNTGEKKEFETDLVKGSAFDVSVTDTIDTTVIPYSVDLDILSVFSEQVQEIFCSQSSLCGNCRKLDKPFMCSLLLSAFSKGQVLLRKTSLPISIYQDSVNEGLNCENVQLLNCSIEEEFLNGDFVYSLELVKRLIAYDYLTFYLALTDENNDFPSYYPVEEMLEAMNYEEILCCIEKDLDVSVSNIVNQELSTFTLNISIDNRPPGVVGDYTLDVEGSILYHTLSSNMFTTDTFPSYYDPEGDNPAAIKILTLPSEGLLVYGQNNNAVSVGQIFTIQEIDSGILKYQTNQTVINDITTSFNFAVSDEGSNLFTS